MSGQNCEPLIAELKQIVTVENDQAYKLLQELLSGVESLNRQLTEARETLEQKDKSIDFQSAAIVDLKLRLERTEAEHSICDLVIHTFKADVEIKDRIIRRYREAMDKIYNHNEAARVAVVQHFGTLHPVTEPTPAGGEELRGD
jgi:chromosome segregation ATPase